MLPLFEAKLNNEEDGIVCVSLVDYPATETDFVLFNKQEEIKFSIDDEEKHILSSVIMVADVPIYRRTNEGYEYNIIYHKDTIREMAEKLLKDEAHNTFDLMHNGERLPKGDINIVELYIVDKEKGISPNFINVPDGSLMASYKIHNDELWNMCKEGTFKGLSLEGVFSIEKEKFESQKDNNIKTKFMNLLERLKDLIVEVEKEEEETPVEEQPTDEPEVEKEEETPVEEQPTDEPEVEKEEETPEEEQPTDEPEVEEPHQDENKELDEVKAQIAEIISQIADLSNRLETIEEEIKKPVEAPIEEKPNEEEQLDKYARIAKFIRK